MALAVFAVVQLIQDMRYRADFVFPLSRSMKFIGLKSVAWIPDFQHYHYPENFSKDELKIREQKESRIFKFDLPLVLSSNDCLKDYKEKYMTNEKNVYVVPFVSFIAPELKGLDSHKEKEILEKYKIGNSKYACVSNQFWRHKNHVVLLQAIKLMHSSLESFKFVFTGLPEDYRDHDYYQSINNLLEDQRVSEHVEVLGFIDRIEQITIMKNAEFVIQPSLFEGWGTVVEDAKVLDKTILVSDISVHREQMNEKCILFDPHDPVSLASLINEECKKDHHFDIEKGLADMYQRAYVYSKGFEKLLCDWENK